MNNWLINSFMKNDDNNLLGNGFNSKKTHETKSPNIFSNIWFPGKNLTFSSVVFGAASGVVSGSGWVDEEASSDTSFVSVASLVAASVASLVA